MALRIHSSLYRAEKLVESTIVESCGMRVSGEVPLFFRLVANVAPNWNSISSTAETGKLHHRYPGINSMKNHSDMIMPVSCPTESTRLNMRYSRIWNRKRIISVTANGISNSENMRNGAFISTSIPPVSAPNI